MFKNLLASVRIGAATVDTRLEGEEFRPGEAFSAQVVVQGGEVDQTIEGLELGLVAEHRADHDELHDSDVIETWEVAEEFTIGAGEEKIIPFEGRLHPETPVTEAEGADNWTDVWMQTGLAIDHAVDAGDRDVMRIYPTEAMEAVLAAVRGAGYHLYNVTSRPDSKTIGGEESELALDQRFVFKPDEGNEEPFIEIDVHFLQRPEGHTNVLLGFEFEDHSERFRNLCVEHDGLDADQVAERVRAEFESAKGE